MNEMPSNRVQVIRNCLFIFAYTIWMVRAFFNTTCFSSASWLEWFNDYGMLVVVLACILCAIIDFRFEAREVLLFFLVWFSYFVAHSVGAKGISVSIILLYAARYVPFRKIAGWTAALVSVLLTFVVSASLLGVIENHVFNQWMHRARYGLGFLYCSYTSHYLLLLFMLYLVLRKKIRWYEVFLLILLNGAGFWATDTKTDIISLVLMIGVTLILRLLVQKKVFLRMLSYIGFAAPFLFWGISLWVSKAYDASSPVWRRIDELLSARLTLGYDALQTYGISLFGQKIKWVGGSAKLKDYTLVYNYVDNNYLASTLQFGIILTFFMCLLYGRAIYISLQKKQIVWAAGLIVFVVIGLINPEMRNLLYNTFWLLLLKPADQFEEFDTHRRTEYAEMGQSKISSADRVGRERTESDGV